MSKLKLDPVSIALICVFGAVVVTLACLPLMTKQASYTPPPTRTSWAPPYDPGYLPSVKPTNKQVCLPGTLGYNGLVTCNRQTDCNSCSDNTGSNSTMGPLECVTVNNSNNQIVDPSSNQLNPPATVHLYRKADGLCSGRGTQKSCGDLEAPNNCTDYWCDCGTEYTSANNDPTNCDVQVLSITQPGSYCLPAYTNTCNPYTSNTILSNTGNGSQWLCECKYPNLGLFVQNAEGSDCDVPIACSAQEPQIVDGNIVKTLAYKSTEGSCKTVPGSKLTDWSFCDLYPNLVASADETATVPCTVPTVVNSVPIDNIHSYNTYNISPLADPKCVVPQFSNTCTVQVALDQGSALATLVMRGSGNINDPAQQRIWPPYPELLPIGLQRCPNGWTGDGTPSNPCTDGKGFKLTYLDNQGQWNGLYRSLQDLRNVGYNNPSASPCTTDCPSGSACTPAGICAPVCPCPSGIPCVNGVCNAVTDGNCVNGVGIPGTLGAIPWDTVNIGCTGPPECIEAPVTLQQISRSLSTPSNIYPFDANLGNTACSSTPAPVCTCPIAVQKTSCKTDSICGTGGSCDISTVFPTVSCSKDAQCNTQQGQFCDTTIGLCVSGLCTCNVDATGYQCTDASSPCSSATGLQRRPYNGLLDGPIVDDNNQQLGGTCSCSGYSTDAMGNKVPLVSAALLNSDPTLQWACVPDPCYTSGTQSYFNPETKRCVCGADASGATYYSWNTNNGVPTCQRDTCNNNGFNSPIQRACSSNLDCSINPVTCDPKNPSSDCTKEGVTCSANKCYMLSSTTCDPNAGTTQCGGVEAANGGKAIQCLQANDGNYYCAVQDPTRPSCNQPSDCNMGICDTKTGLCTGGCVCSGNTDPYFTDANPLHSSCTNPCTFDPCGANGVCVANSDGTYKCNCLNGYSGDSCEIRNCKSYFSDCVHDAECCSDQCNYFFLQGYKCDVPTDPNS